MKTKKRLISLFLSLIMILSITAGLDFSAYALSNSGSCGNTAKYSFNESTGELVISGTGKINDYAFIDESSIKKVTINPGITSIGDSAFMYCDNLITIALPDGITNIGEFAFGDCECLSNFAIPNSLKKICNYAFSGCTNLTIITIPNNVETIGQGSFEDCTGIVKLTIPNNIKCVEDYAFSGVKNIIYNGDLSGDWGNEFKNKHVDGNLVYYNSKKSNLLACSTAIKGSLTIPNSVTNIESNAFCGCKNLTNITLPNSVTSIGNDAFRGCENLISATLPNTLTKINNYMFSNCSSLTNITIPNSVINIGACAFENCTSIKSITIPQSVKSIGEGAFYKCSSIKSITIPNSVKNIGHDTFSYCLNLLSVTIKNNFIANHMFSNCTSLESIKIPSSISTIDQFAFYNCTNLSSIIISNSVKNVCSDAFLDCYSLKNVYFAGTKDEWGNIVFDLGNENLTNANMHYNYICDVHSSSNTIKENTKKATIKSNGSYEQVVYCSICKYEISRTKKTIYYPKTITLSTTKYTYDGKVKSPTLTVKDSAGKALVKGTDYTVTTPSGRKNVGKYTYKITFKGNYSGTKSLSFTIVPKSTTISSLTAASKGFTVKWKKQATQTSGYQIQIATDSKFTKGVKSYTVTKNSTVSKKITKLTGGKKYYVRIRTYKTVSGTKYYSSWSAKKYVTTKK